VDYISAETVKTRKPHKCWGCAREFPKGTMLQRIVNADGGTIYTTYWCPVCNEAWAAGDYDSDSTIDMGDLKREDPAWETIRAKLEDKLAFPLICSNCGQLFVCAPAAPVCVQCGERTVRPVEPGDNSKEIYDRYRAKLEDKPCPNSTPS